MPDFKQPTAVTDSGNKEIVSSNTANGGTSITDGETSIGFGFNKDGVLGMQISDGSVIFVSITRDGIVINDGVNDRILIGKHIGGF